MRNLNNDGFVSDRTQVIFQALIAGGTDLGGLLALVSSVYADGGNHVLDQLQEKMSAFSK